VPAASDAGSVFSASERIDCGACKKRSKTQAEFGGDSIPSIMLHQALAHFTGRDSYDCIHPSIVGWGTTKHLNTDNTFLQLLESSGKRLIHNALKCATLTISLVQNIGQATMAARATPVR
jgi:hypothetical protein